MAEETLDEKIERLKKDISAMSVECDLAKLTMVRLEKSHEEYELARDVVQAFGSPLLNRVFFSLQYDLKQALYEREMAK